MYHFVSSLACSWDSVARTTTSSPTTNRYKLKSFFAVIFIISCYYYYYYYYCLLFIYYFIIVGGPLPPPNGGLDLPPVPTEGFSSTTGSEGGGDVDFDDLTRRFEELKKRK